MMAAKMLARLVHVGEGRGHQPDESKADAGNDLVGGRWIGPDLVHAQEHNPGNSDGGSDGEARSGTLAEQGPSEERVGNEKESGNRRDDSGRDVTLREIDCVIVPAELDEA